MTFFKKSSKMLVMERLGLRIHITRWVLMQGAWSALVTLSFLFPLLLFFTLIPICFLTAFFYVKNFRINALLLFATQVTGCVISGGDFVVVTFTVLTVAGVLGAIWGLKCKHYQHGAAVTALFMLAASVFSLMFFSSFSGEKPSDFLADYAEQKLESNEVFLTSTSQVKWVHRAYYWVLKINDELLDENDNLITFEVSKELFVEALWDFGENRAYYDFMAFGTTCGLVIFLALFIFDRKTKRFGLKRKNEFIVFTEPILFKNMRLNKNFFNRIFVPIFVFMFLGYLTEFNLLVVAIVNNMITIPCNFAGISLFYHTICRIKKRSYLAWLQLNAVLIFVCCACMLFPIISIIVGMIGLCDSVINMRRLLDYALG